MELAWWLSSNADKARDERWLLLQPLTQAYFVTYFVVLTVAWRGLRRWLGPSRWVSVGTLLVVAFTIAFAETFLMASDALAGVFGYADRSRMLALGSWGYAIYFVVGVPMLAPVDERGAGDWPLSRVFMTACAACMLILVGLEIWAQLVGPL